MSGHGRWHSKQKTAPVQAWPRLCLTCKLASASPSALCALTICFPQKRIIASASVLPAGWARHTCTAVRHPLNQACPAADRLRAVSLGPHQQGVQEAGGDCRELDAAILELHCQEGHIKGDDVVPSQVAAIKERVELLSQLWEAGGIRTCAVCDAMNLQPRSRHSCGVLIGRLHAGVEQVSCFKVCDGVTLVATGGMLLGGFTSVLSCSWCPSGNTLMAAISTMYSPALQKPVVSKSKLMSGRCSCSSARPGRAGRLVSRDPSLSCSTVSGYPAQVQL